MSMYTTAKTWDEIMKVVESLEPPSCLSVNYDPDEEEYKIWCGNQPYYFYQDEIEKLDDEKRVLKKEVKRLNSIIDRLAED
ncbi:hypothetical protein [Bacillus thuringiensis]|uniref:hypothetical protein n=1 Tax=Bacillus thuringiensis TaxID=1428 RepID=UPI003F5CDDCC